MDMLHIPLPMERPVLTIRQETTIDADCIVIIDGKPATVADLKEGMEVVYTIRGSLIVRITATSKRK